MADLKLVLPEEKYKMSFIEAFLEGLNGEEDVVRIENDFDGWLKDTFDLSIPVTLPDGTQVPRVPHTLFWLVDGTRVIGQISIRHELSENLKQVGGHIGYSIRASEREKGYGKLMLQMALPFVRKLGLEKALITCDDDNAGSIMVIEGAGGILQDKIDVTGRAVPHRRYWLAL